MAGALIGALKAPLAIIADSASFLVAAIAITSSRRGIRGATRLEARPAAPGTVRQVLTGIRFTMGDPILRSVTLATCTFIFCYTAFTSLFVLYLTRSVHLSASALGLLLGVGAVGGLVGSVLAPMIGRRFGLAGTLQYSLVGASLGAALATLVLTPRWLAVALIALSQFVLWFGQQIYNVHQVPLRYARSPAHLQGRVNATIRSIVWGVAPLGALLAGFVADHVGIRITLTVSALAGTAAMIWIRNSPIAGTRRLPDEPVEAPNPVLEGASR